jgi:hypothetical protein
MQKHSNCGLSVANVSDVVYDVKNPVNVILLAIAFVQMFLVLTCMYSSRLSNNHPNLEILMLAPLYGVHILT